MFMCRLNEEKTSPFHRSVRWTGNEAQCQITQKTTPGGAGVHRSAAGSPLRRRNIPPDGLKKKNKKKKVAPSIFATEKCKSSGKHLHKSRDRGRTPAVSYPSVCSFWTKFGSRVQHMLTHQRTKFKSIPTICWFFTIFWVSESCRSRSVSRNRPFRTLLICISTPNLAVWFTRSRTRIRANFIRFRPSADF